MRRDEEAAVANDVLAQRWVRSVLGAVAWDSYLSVVEGDDGFAVPSNESVADLIHAIKKRSRERVTRPQRYTPFGVPTDDSQFMAAGLLAAIESKRVPGKSFASSYVEHWSRFHQQRLWRNTGARFKKYLGGEKAVLVGGISVGDMLRVLPFSLFGSDEASREVELRAYGEILGLTARQLEMFSRFLAFTDHHLRGQVRVANMCLGEALRVLTPDESKDNVILRTLERGITSQWTFGRFLSEASRESRDLDTIGYLGGFFFSEKGFELERLNADETVGFQHYRELALTTALIRAGLDASVEAKDLFAEFTASERATQQFVERLRSSMDAEELLRRLDAKPV